MEVVWVCCKFLYCRLGESLGKLISRGMHHTNLVAQLVCPYSQMEAEFDSCGLSENSVAVLYVTALQFFIYTTLRNGHPGEQRSGSEVRPTHCHPSAVCLAISTSTSKLSGKPRVGEAEGDNIGLGFLSIDPTSVTRRRGSRRGKINRINFEIQRFRMIRRRQSRDR